MASGSRIYAASNPSSITHHYQPQLDSSSFYLSGASGTFLGSSSMFTFEDAKGRKTSCKTSKSSFFQSFDQEDSNGDDQGYYEYFNQSGKRRRLSLDQLNFLEKSFEMDKKLEPDRKIQLAKDLGLQPRQVGIWFQNRRARWKTKQMEKDFDVLQESFNSLKASYDSLCHEKENLTSQIALLAEEFALKQKGKGTSVGPSQTLLENPSTQSISDSEESKASAVASKQDKYLTSPAKMDNGVFDSYSTSIKKDDMFETDSHFYINGCSGSMHTPHLENADSSYMLEPDNSDLSQDEDDTVCYLPSTPHRLLPKLEPGNYSLASSSTSGNFSFPAFWSWSF